MRSRRIEPYDDDFCQTQLVTSGLYIVSRSGCAGASGARRLFLRARESRRAIATADRGAESTRGSGMRTSLRTGWRTVGHDDLGLRLRRALAHGFDTSSIFHRTPAPGVANDQAPLFQLPPEAQCRARFSDPRARDSRDSFDRRILPLPLTPNSSVCSTSLRILVTTIVTLIYGFLGGSQREIFSTIKCKCDPPNLDRASVERLREKRFNRNASGRRTRDRRRGESA